MCVLALPLPISSNMCCRRLPTPGTNTNAAAAGRLKRPRFRTERSEAMNQTAIAIPADRNVPRDWVM